MVDCSWRCVVAFVTTSYKYLFQYSAVHVSVRRMPFDPYGPEGDDVWHFFRCSNFSEWLLLQLTGHINTNRHAYGCSVSE